jgi:Cu-processing system ATP-binding protein
MISVKNLSKSFGKNQVLKRIDVSFDQPGIISILGPNGSGKTTLIKSILGMVIPDSGEISFRDKDVLRKWSYRNEIGYLPQIARFPENLTVRELLRMIQNIRSREGDYDQLIDLFELHPFINKRLGHLSGGTRQKVNLVQTFMYDNPVIILDEPTTGLDPVSLINLKELLRKERAKDKIILITTHIMSFVEEMAEELVFLLEGKIHYRGNPGDLKGLHETKDLESAIAQMLKNQAEKIGKNFVQSSIS